MNKLKESVEDVEENNLKFNLKLGILCITLYRCP